MELIVVLGKAKILVILAPPSHMPGQAGMGVDHIWSFDQPVAGDYAGKLVGKHRLI